MPYITSLHGGTYVPGSRFLQVFLYMRLLRADYYISSAILALFFLLLLCHRTWKAT